ncbi:MAG TPA: radical SAM protein [Deltaproteobacteria bacterium]|nr:radical SAM protein [Deltaproteobacteria bacterium]
MTTTQDDILSRYGAGLDRAQRQLLSRHGERYARYRRDYEAAGAFAYEPDFPLYIMLEQSYRCNLGCPSCIHGLPDVKRRFDTDGGVMSRELFERIVIEGERNSCPSMAFHVNDEPLLVKDLPERVAFAAAHGFMDLFVTTNGLLLDEQLMRRLVESGLTRILFSVDAATEKTYEKVRPGGDFSKVLANIRCLKEYKREHELVLPATRASFVATSLNAHEQDLFVETFSDLVDYVEVQGYSTYYDYNHDLVPAGAHRLDDFTCNEPWRKLIVRANGDVLPCCSFYGYEIPLGNVYEHSLREIFNGPLCSRLRSDLRRGVYSLAACRACAGSFHTLSEA